jgi:hypothetical protein
MSSDLLTPREVDRLLRYPRGRSARLARKGKLQAIFLPDGEIRFDPETIQRLIVPRLRATGELRLVGTVADGDEVRK